MISIFNEDALSKIEEFDAESFDICITDPPYSAAFVGKLYKLFKKHKSIDSLRKKDSTSNNWNWGGIPGNWSEMFYKTNREFEEFTLTWMSQIFRVIKPGSFLVFFGTQKLCHININLGLSAGFILRDVWIWKYKYGYSKGTSDKNNKKLKTLVANSYEPIFILQKPIIENTFIKNKSKYGTGFIDTSEIVSNILEVDKPSKLERQGNPHYSQKPLKLLEKLCLGFKPGSIIDPFMGTSPLGEVSANLSIDYTGIEIEKSFFDFAKERLHLKK